MKVVDTGTTQGYFKMHVYTQQCCISVSTYVGTYVGCCRQQVNTYHVMNHDKMVQNTICVCVVCISTEGT